MRADGEFVSLDDDTVFAFWRSHCAAEQKSGNDFRMFESVLSSFVNFIRAVELAERGRSLAHAVPVGQDFDAGEFDVSAERTMADLVSEPWVSPLEVLAEPPADQVKFLTNREANELTMLMKCGPESMYLPLSVLRADVFGRRQRRLVQAMRLSAGPDEIASLADCGDAESYGTRMDVLNGLGEQVETMTKAVAYIVLSAGEENVLDHVASIVEAVPPDEVQARLAEGRKIYQRMSRKGFSSDVIDDPDAIEAFRVGGEALIALERCIRNYLDELRHLDDGDEDVATRFETDRAIFREMFETIYGVQP
jgi:hypothetical protein